MVLLVILATRVIAVTTHTTDLLSRVHIHRTAGFGKLATFLHEHLDGDAGDGSPNEDHCDEQQLEHVLSLNYCLR